MRVSFSSDLCHGLLAKPLTAVFTSSKITGTEVVASQHQTPRLLQCIKHILVADWDIYLMDYGNSRLGGAILVSTAMLSAPKPSEGKPKH